MCVEEGVEEGKRNREGGISVRKAEWLNMITALIRQKNKRHIVASKSCIPSDAGHPTFMQHWT